MEVFANLATATVTSGGTTAPASGTTESWTVSGSTFPAVSNSAVPPTTAHVVEDSLTRQTEIILVTNISGTTWSVTRGAEGTTPVTHPAGFTVVQVPTALVMNNMMAVTGIFLETIYDAAATVKTNILNVALRVPVACTLWKVHLWATTPPTGSAITIDILNNGSVIGTATLAAGASAQSTTIGPDTLAAGDKITFNITAIGSTVAGSGIGIQLEAY